MNLPVSDASQLPDGSELRLSSLFTVVVIILACGCNPTAPAKPARNKLQTRATWHEKHHWNAEDFFHDEQVIALCRAIEADDLHEMERLIHSGADCNAIGRGNMTPLLWAFVDDRPERFLLLLQHGANPNVIFTSNFGVQSFIFAGSSVTHMAASTRFGKHFDYVFDHGGDPNLICNTPLATDSAPMRLLLCGSASDKLRKVQRLIELGADLDHIDGMGRTPAEHAVSRGRYDIALCLLKAGANPRIESNGTSHELADYLDRRKRDLQHLSTEQKEYRKEILSLLESD